MTFIFAFFILISGITLLAYCGAPLWGWAVGLAILATIINSTLVLLLSLAICAAIALPMLREKIRPYLFPRLKKYCPVITESEQKQLADAVYTGWEKDLFNGTIESAPAAQTALTEAERAFLAQETEELCALLDETEIAQQQSLSKAAQKYIEEHGFQALTIAKERGGRGFSTTAAAHIMAKIASHSPSALLYINADRATVRWGMSQTALYLSSAWASMATARHGQKFEDELADIAGLTYQLRALQAAAPAAQNQNTLTLIGQAQGQSLLTALIERSLALQTLASTEMLCTPLNHFHHVLPHFHLSQKPELTALSELIGQHDFWLEESQAISQQQDLTLEKVLFRHARQFLRHYGRSVVLGITHGKGFKAPAPFVPELFPYYAQLTRLAASFALIKDVAVVSRAIDDNPRFLKHATTAFAALYRARATLAFWQNNGAVTDELALAQYGLTTALFAAENAIYAMIEAFSCRKMVFLMKCLCFPLGRRQKCPSHALILACAQAVENNAVSLKNLTQELYLGDEKTNPAVATVHSALKTLQTAAAAEYAIHQAHKAGTLTAQTFTARVDEACDKDVISEQMRQEVFEAQRLMKSMN